MTMTDKFAEIFNASIDEFKRVEIPLYAAFTAAGSNTDTYKVPGQYKLCIERISAHLAMLDMASEPLAIGNMTSVQSLQERIIAHAMNCRIQLQNIDTTINILGENHLTNLATLMQIAGGCPREYGDVPQIVLAGQTLQLTATVLASTAGLGDKNTEYGVLISGLLVRVKGDK